MSFKALPMIAVLSALGVVLSLNNASAATIIKPTGVTADYSLYPAVNTISGGGLSSDLLTGDPLPGVYPTHDGSVVWTSPFGSPVPTIVFDLGAVYDVSGFHLWNYNESGYTTIGYREASFSFSTTSGVAGFGSPDFFSGANQLAQATGALSYTGETKSFSATHTARWIQLDRITNWGQPNYAAGISEIRFIGQLYVEPAPAPEPTSLALLGLGVLAMARRMRRRS